MYLEAYRCALAVYVTFDIMPIVKDKDYLIPLFEFMYIIALVNENNRIIHIVMDKNNLEIKLERNLDRSVVDVLGSIINKTNLEIKIIT